MKTGIAYVGCGFVADFYQSCMPNSQDALEVRGVWDHDAERLDSFTQFYGLNAYGSLEELLADDGVRIVVNLTNPDQHYPISRAALEAGKHVYSEKPLAMDLDDARMLVELAAGRGLEIAGAPCNVLSETAQTLWRAVREGTAGTPRLVYSEIDDGRIHQIGCENWRSVSGAPWPVEDEFRVGCTMEHAGYALSWLAAIFGPVRRVVAFSSLRFPNKGALTPENYTTPDFSAGCLEFDDGISARITNSIIAPHDHRFRIFCDNGELRTSELWNYAAPVVYTPVLQTRIARVMEKRLGYTPRKTLAPARRQAITTARKAANMDFTRGIAEMAEALDAGRKPRLGGDFALHITEVSLALQHPERFGADYRVTSTFAPMEPMPWAV